jgi:hypothetical protein
MKVGLKTDTETLDVFYKETKPYITKIKPLLNAINENCNSWDDQD